MQIGELVRIENNETVPCDVILLYTRADGIAFVDTSSLDGETNLKEKLAPFVGPEEDQIPIMTGRMYCDLANSHLDEWNAEMMGTSFDEHVFADIKSLLLRGTTLKNTDFALGISVSLGNKTKIMMNQRKPKGKISAMMKMMNYLLYSVFAFQMLIIIAFASLSTGWNGREQRDYLGE